MHAYIKTSCCTPTVQFLLFQWFLNKAGRQETNTKFFLVITAAIYWVLCQALSILTTIYIDTHTVYIISFNDYSKPLEWLLSPHSMGDRGGSQQRMKTSEKLSDLLKAVQIYMWQNQNLDQFWSLWTPGYMAWNSSNYPHSLAQEPAPLPPPPTSRTNASLESGCPSSF